MRKIHANWFQHVLHQKQASGNRSCWLRWVLFDLWSYWREKSFFSSGASLNNYSRPENLTFYRFQILVNAFVKRPLEIVNFDSLQSSESNLEPLQLRWSKSLSYKLYRSIWHNMNFQITLRREVCFFRDGGAAAAPTIKLGRLNPYDYPPPWIL